MIVARHTRWLTCLTLFATVAASSAPAQNNFEGVSVIATGTTFSPPDRIEMAVTVSGSAQLAGEAATKFRGQRDRLLEALQSLGIDDLKTRSGKVAVSGSSGTTRNQYGQMVPNTQGSFSLSETLTIDLPATDSVLDTVTRIYDVGKDLGIAFSNPPTGGGSLVGAKFLGEEDAKKAAYKDAMTKARAQAQAIAELAGRELGDVAAVSVTSVNTTSAARSSHQHGMQQVIINGVVQFQPIGSAAVATSSESDTLTRQRTAVTLNVRFAFK